MLDSFRAPRLSGGRPAIHALTAAVALVSKTRRLCPRLESFAVTVPSAHHCVSASWVDCTDMGRPSARFFGFSTSTNLRYLRTHKGRGYSAIHG
jgi:hypothetical protein